MSWTAGYPDKINRLFALLKEHNMKTHLKIKILTLADEAKHIRRHERRWKTVRRDGLPHPMFFNLEAHRKHEVRPECRASLLAYGFLRDRDYKKIENRCHTKPNWDRVATLLTVFGKHLYPDLAPAPRKKAIGEELKVWYEKIPNM